MPLHDILSLHCEVELANIAREVVQEGGELFCFDEMNVTDIGDAVILRLLFEHMISIRLCNEEVLLFT